MKFKHITTADGLSNTRVVCITQDHEGFLWFGTRDGLNRFDGINFTIFRYDREDSLSISHNRIKNLFVDSSNQLWVATERGLNRYIKGVGFERFLHDKADPTSLGENFVHSIWEDTKKNLWLATRNGLEYFDRKSKTFKHYRYEKDKPGSLLDNWVKRVFVDSEGTLWVLTNAGIDKYVEEQDAFLHYPFIDQTSGRGNTPDPNCIAEDSNGRIWVGYQGGLLLYDPQQDSFQDFVLEQNGKVEKVFNNQVRAIEEDDYSNLWIGAYDGLYIIHAGLEQFTLYTHDNSKPYSLSQNSVYAVFQDKVGDIWVGTYSGAINYYDKNFAVFEHYNVSSGLSHHVVSAFLEESNGDFWIGTEGGGLNYFDVANRQFRHFRREVSNPKSLSADNVKGISRDSRGKLYIATHGGGLNIMDPMAGPDVFTHFRHHPSDNLSIPSDFINSILCDSQDRIWIGFVEKALMQLVPETGKFVLYPKFEEGLSTVRCIFEDRQNRVLVGINSGLWWVDPARQSLNEAGLEELNRSLNTDITGVAQDSAGNYWLATDGEGLFFLEKDWSSFENYRQKDGLASDFLFGILPDETGNLWISSNNGLSKFDPETKQIEKFDAADGLQSNEFNSNAYLVSSRGKFLFGGINGFNIFDPRKIRKNDFQPPVVITNFSVNNESDTLRIDLDKTSPDQLVLRYNQSPFTFDFIALNYAQPQKSTYFYQLEGYNEGWVDNGNRGYATFTFIDPGTYTFRVKAKNKDGIWSSQEGSVRLRILPPPGKTWWAYSLYGLVLMVLGMFIRKQVLLRIRDKKALRREKREREKIEELNEMKLQFFTNVSHELRTPLTLILGPLERMLGEGKASDPRRNQDLVLIEQNAKRMLRHVNNILDFRKYEMGKLKLKAAKGNIVRFLKEATLSFQDTALARTIDYRFSTQKESIEAYYDRDKMEIILFNLLSNAFKFTADGGRIEVSVAEDTDPVEHKKMVKIVVSDNGKGMKPENAAQVFDRFYQVENENGVATPGSGLGLTLTKSLVELHHGVIRLDTLEGKGTKFTILLPLGKDHLQQEELLKNFKSSEDASLYQFRTSRQKLTERRLAKTQKRNTPNPNLPSLLIVEDNDEVRNFIVRCFVEEYNIREATNGKDGLAFATEHLPDLIISDVMMPEMDGITLCRKLKKDFRTSHIPVVLLTARTSVIFKKSGMETGADDYITKPFTPSLLKLRVKNLVAARKRLHQYFLRNYKVKPDEIRLTSRDEVFIEQALQLIEERMDDSTFSVEAFARAMGMSRTSLFTKLKGLTGLSVSEFIRSIRIKRAGQLLLQDRYTISEVAYRVGFNDLKYFRTCFKKHFDCTPSQYIEQGVRQRGTGKAKNSKDCGKNKL